MRRDVFWLVTQAALVVAAIALGGWAFLVAVDNPDIHHTSRGETYTCLAPWDTTLNGADNYPGGEPPPDGDDIAARCQEAGRERFSSALHLGGWAFLCALVAGVLPLVRSTGRVPETAP